MSKASGPVTFLLVALLGCSSSHPTTNSGGTGVIGASGGTVSLTDELGDAVVVDVPAGALSSDQTITITRTTEAAPAGFVAYSPIYRFAPNGLEFTDGVTVTIAYRTAVSNPEMIWTTADETGWESRGGVAVGSTVRAFTRHFSGGFVGEPVEDDAAVTSDGGVDASIDVDTGVP